MYLPLTICNFNLGIYVLVLARIVLKYVLKLYYANFNLFLCTMVAFEFISILQLP